MKKTYLLLFILTLFSCKEFQENDIIGRWKSDDGCILQINKDHTFEIKNLPEWILFDNYISKKLYSSTGTWEFIRIENNLTVNLSFPKSKRIPCAFGRELSYEKELYSKNGYWSVYFYDGANDEKYFFHKIK